MQDRYLFRGKRIDNGEWVMGYLTKQRHSPKDSKYSPPYELQFVIDHEEKGVMLTSFVDPATVGQCIGLKDKNGKLIFEGDIVIGQIRFDDTGKVEGAVEYDCLEGLYCVGNNPLQYFVRGTATDKPSTTTTIINNIHDKEGEDEV